MAGVLQCPDWSRQGGEKADHGGCGEGMLSGDMLETQFQQPASGVLREGRREEEKNGRRDGGEQEKGGGEGERGRERGEKGRGERENL